MKYDDILRVRASRQLKQRLESIAVIKRRALPDLLRIALEDYCDEQESLANQPEAKEGREATPVTSPYVLNDAKRRKAG